MIKILCVTYCEKYYDKCNKHMNNDVTSASSVPLTLYDESIFSPENAQTYGQQLIIYHHLLHQYKLRKYFDQATTNTPVHLPTQQTILCEGLPGVGKSWVIKTLRNITRRLHGMDSDIATTPTGCLAFQIDGSTHYPSFFFCNRSGHKMFLRYFSQIVLFFVTGPVAKTNTTRTPKI